MISIINYQRGNLNNVARAFYNFGFPVEIIDKPVDLSQKKGVVLPGVGAFSDAMATLKKTGFDRLIKEYIAQNKPFLGICLGLQLLFEESEEFGFCEGLGIFPGKVVRFSFDNNQKLKIPHMGWNNIELPQKSRIIPSLKNGDFFYFVHSYYVQPQDKQLSLCYTHYGISFTCAIEKGNLFACQFHPEKSQKQGLAIIRDFGNFCFSLSSE